MLFQTFMTSVNHKIRNSLRLKKACKSHVNLPYELYSIEQVYKHIPYNNCAPLLMKMDPDVGLHLFKGRECQICEKKTVFWDKSFQRFG